SDDMVEAVKVARRHLPRSQVADVDAVLLCNRAGATVGRASDVPIAGAGAVYFDVDAEPVSLPPQCRFGKRGAADVAEADEQHVHDAAPAAAALTNASKNCNSPSPPPSNHTSSRISIPALQSRYLCMY
ncbi:MAG: hypothetical protein M1823_008113, partial [Watsoniomyces obsoletus]